MKALVDGYNAKKDITIEDIIAFHAEFEYIHPFQDGNGRVGRLLMFKECMANGHVPFIITDELKMFYYRGLREWGNIKNCVKDALSSYVYQQTKRSPMILPVIMEKSGTESYNPSIISSIHTNRRYHIRDDGTSGLRTIVGFCRIALKVIRI